MHSDFNKDFSIQQFVYFSEAGFTQQDFLRQIIFSSYFKNKRKISLNFLTSPYENSS